MVPKGRQDRKKERKKDSFHFIALTVLELQYCLTRLQTNILRKKAFLSPKTLVKFK